MGIEAASAIAQSILSGLKGSDVSALLEGEILLETTPHSMFGGAVTARMYLPIQRSQVWQQLTTYSQWVHFFPDIVRSEIIEHDPHRPHRGYRLYQAAKKTFVMFTAQVEIYLRVFENMQRQIRFHMEKGSFTDFSADLTLDDYGDGTVLTYAVKATPVIPIPNIFVEQAMRQELPMNMRQMRQVICNSQCQAA
jgi:hypothetical protein